MLLLLQAGATLAAPAQILVSPAQFQRAGILTAPVLMRPQDPAPASAGNDVVLSGTVLAPPASIAVVSPAYGGLVQHVHVNSLQSVTAGTPVVTLFSQPWMEVQRDFVQAATQARLAAAKLARDESLFADGIIAAVRLEESRSAAVLAELAVEERRQALRAGGADAAALDRLLRERTLSPTLVVRAPAQGTLLELEATAGQRLEAGAPLAKIGRGGPLWVDLQASRQQAAQLRIGDILEVKGCGRIKVAAISPLVNSSSQSAQVRAVQVDPDGCLKINAFVEARRRPDSASGPTGFVVPGRAVVRQGDATYVFVKKSRGFAAVPVSASSAGADMVWIQGALAAGDQVAVEGIVAIKGIWAGLGADHAAAPAAAATGSK